MSKITNTTLFPNSSGTFPSMTQEIWIHRHLSKQAILLKDAYYIRVSGNAEWTALIRLETVEQTASNLKIGKDWTRTYIKSPPEPVLTLKSRFLAIMEDEL